MKKEKEVVAGKELAILYPETLKVETREGTVEVKPIPVARIGRASKHLRAFITAGGTVTPEGTGLDMTKLLEDADNAVAFVAAAVDWPLEQVGALLPDDFMKVIQAVIEVNKDFFVKSVAPLVSEALATMNQATTVGAGPTQLNS